MTRMVGGFLYKLMVGILTLVLFLSRIGVRIVARAAEGVGARLMVELVSFLVSFPVLFLFC